MMFDLNKHQHDYFYDMVTVVDNLIPASVCNQLGTRVNKVIDAGQVDHVMHSALGTEAVSDLGGEYNHHIFKGQDVRKHLPELNAIYHAILPLVSAITCSDAVVSPHHASDINIKAYPPGGGTLGLHYDTNGITVLLFLTDNTEAPLRLQIERSHPSRKDSWIEKRSIYAKKGSLLVMQGRKVLHDCEATRTEQKLTVVFNYYERNDTYRHPDFDNFVYHGIRPRELA